MGARADSRVSLVLVVMAGAALASMLATLRIDQIVHHDLYGYGLRFSTDWAVPYWTMASVVFEMGWLTIMTSIVFEIYSIIHPLHRPLEPESEVETEIVNPLQEPMQTEVPGASGSIQVTARNNGPAPLTVNELSVNEVKHASVSPALPCTIPPSCDATFVILTSVIAGCTYQVRLVSAKGNVFTYTLTARTRVTPKTVSEPTEEPEEKPVTTTALAVKKEKDDLTEFRVMLEEASVMTSAAVARQKAEKKPKSE